MERNIPLKVKAIACASLALGGLTACGSSIKEGDLGVSKDNIALVTLGTSRIENNCRGTD